VIGGGGCAPAAQRFSITGGDGVQRTLYHLPGEVNGKPGVFEWIVDESSGQPVINHQRFIPGGRSPVTRTNDHDSGVRVGTRLPRS